MVNKVKREYETPKMEIIVMAMEKALMAASGEEEAKPQSDEIEYFQEGDDF